jgi:peptide/nickel transport system substrate-binding protein
MLHNKKIKLLLIVSLAIIVLGSACGKQTGTTPTNKTSTAIEATLTATPIPQKTLVVCLGEEPQSLYLYKGTSRAMWSVLEAIYDGPIDTQDFQATPVILNELPTLENGGVTLQSISVVAGDQVANVAGDLVTLEKGVQVFPEGCTSLDCATEWDGKTELKLVQMSARFTIKPGITWSDGIALTADDSVYSFQVSSDPATNVSKNLINRTSSYRAVDAQTIEWSAVPGYLTFNPAAFFWIPLPKHLLGQKTAAELNSAAETNEKPIGWGPYMVDEWVTNDHIRLVKNPNYFRASEGLPKFDVLVFRFVPGMPETDLSPLANGECDIMDTSVGLETQLQSLRELEIAGKTKLYFGKGPEWELINFGIKPAGYDDGYNPWVDRPDYFADIRVRQGFAACINRDKILKDPLYSQSEIPLSYLPPTHPYLVTGLPKITYDPARGSQLLAEAGWVDSDGDPATPRKSSGIEGIADGTEFAITYNVTESALHKSVTDIVVNSLAECGVKVTPQYLSVENMYASGPDGVVFGRAFDLAELAWSAGRVPPCFLYASTEIPTAKNSWLGTKYGGVNITGYKNQSYDDACSRLLSAGLNKTAFDADNTVTQTLMAEELPVIPLFYHLKIMAARPDLCGLSLDVSARSPLNNIETYDLTEGTCQ